MGQKAKPSLQGCTVLDHENGCPGQTLSPGTHNRDQSSVPDKAGITTRRHLHVQPASCVHKYSLSAHLGARQSYQHQHLCALQQPGEKAAASPSIISTGSSPQLNT